MNPDDNPTESGDSLIPATNAEVLTGQDNPPYTDKINEAQEGVTDLLITLIAEAKEKFKNKSEVKKLSIPELLGQIEKILKALKSSTVILPKGAQMNLTQIGHYGNTFQAADASRRKEIRAAVNQKLRKLPR